MSTSPPSTPKPHADLFDETIANAPVDERPATEEDERILAERQADPHPVWISGEEVTGRLAERIRREHG